MVHAAACDAVAQFAADDALRAAVLGLPSERAALVQGVTQLTAATWIQAEDPNTAWVAVSVLLRSVKSRRNSNRQCVVLDCVAGWLTWRVGVAGLPREQPGGGTGECAVPAVKLGQLDMARAAFAVRTSMSAD